MQSDHNKEVKDSFKHWGRMYRWLENYSDFKEVWSKNSWHKFMKIAINETPSPDFCALCQKYESQNCSKCPLVSCAGGSIWKKIVFSETKEEWLINAKKLIKKLFELRFYDDI